MSVISYKCPNCDGELIFDPAAQKYRCEYCTSAFSQEEIEHMKPAAEQGIIENSESAAEQGEIENSESAAEQGEIGIMYQCPSCGAQIVTDETTAATFCYYCHNPVVLSGRVSGEFLPDKIIPFSIDKERAIEIFLEYVRRKKFVPRAFFNKKQIEKIAGVYFPYWMVDMDIGGSLQAEGKNFRVWRTGDTEYRETKIYQIERGGIIHLEDITKNALKKNSQKLAEGVLPYDVSKAQDFHMGYLSGFLAEKRDLERADLQQGVTAEAQNFGERMMRNTVSGYSSLNVRSCLVSPQRENWDYILLPVWTITYQGRDGRIYYYSINGQNGKVFGELPIDKCKAVLTGIFVFALVFLLALLGGLMI